MSNLVILSENPAFIVVLTTFAIIFLFIGFVVFNVLSKVNKLERTVSALKNMGSDSAAVLVNFYRRWEEWENTFEQFDKKNSDAIVLIEQIRAEQELLTKVLGSENKLSRAIELARSGSSVDEIILATGVNSDEAEAVVKFHGPDNFV